MTSAVLPVERPARVRAASEAGASRSATFAEFARRLPGATAPVDPDDRIIAWAAGEAARFSPEPLDRARFLEEKTLFPVLSYADHHGPLAHALLLNSNVLLAYLARIGSQRHVLTLATGSIPLSNESYPKGFLFGGRKLSFFPSRLDDLPVCGVRTPAIEPGGNLKALFPNLDARQFTDGELRFLRALFFDLLDVADLAGRWPRYSDFVSALNARLWPYLFEEPVRKSLPRLAYLMSNDLVRRLLADALADPRSLLSAYLFDAAARKLVIAECEGIRGCWSAGGRGTYFFWKRRKDGRLARMAPVGDGSALADGEDVLPLEAEAVIAGLASGDLVPALFFDFLVLVFLDGLTCLGGLFQEEYLPRMQEAHCRVLARLGMEDERRLFAGRRTRGVICGYRGLPYRDSLDLLWRRNSARGSFSGPWSGGISEADLKAAVETPLGTPPDAARSGGA